MLPNYIICILSVDVSFSWQSMASDIYDLEDIEGLYCDDELDGTIVSQTQYEDGRTQLLEVWFSV